MKIQIDKPNTNHNETWPVKRLRVYSVNDNKTFAFAANAMSAFEYAHKQGLSRSGLWASEWGVLTRSLSFTPSNV